MTKVVDHGYEAVVIRTADYYPYGMLMPGRHKDHAPNNYRFGYNGMELDNAIKNNGNSYTTEFRLYDPRLGRWLSLDPLMAKYPWMSPYTAFNNNPIFFIDPLGLEGVEPSEADKVNGTWKHPDSGVEYKYDKDADIWYNPDSHVVVFAPKNVAVITITEHSVEPGFFQKIGNFFRSVDNQLKGNSTWTFGIEFKTRDGIWNGNTANPVSLKDGKNVWTIYWDDIEDFTTALKALDKELPKEFRDSPDYSGPGKFLDEAKKYVGPPTESTYKPNKQEDGKNWDSKENRIQNKSSEDIYIKVWKRYSHTPNSASSETAGPFKDEKAMKEKYPDAKWNNEKGYWEGNLYNKIK